VSWQRSAFVFLSGYVLLMHVIPIASMTGYGWLIPGTVLQFIMGAATVAFAAIYAGSATRFGGPRLSMLDLLVIAYLCLCLASFASYMKPAHPVQSKAFVYGVHHLLIPVPLFLAAKVTTHERRLQVLRLICYANVFMMLAGFVLFIARPAFYTAYLASYYRESRNLIPLDLLYIRFASYMGSTAVGLLAALTIVLAAQLRLSKIVTVVIPPLMLGGALLSQQRGGMAATFIALAYFAVSRQQTRGLKVTALAFSAAVIVAGVVVAQKNYPGLVEYTLLRFASFGDALGERAGSYGIGWTYVLAHPFGMGLGATSSAAFNAGLNFAEEVTDANFLRILADVGVPGFLLFALIIVGTAWRGLRARAGLAWPLAMGIYVLIALGTNVLDSFYLAHVFWILAATIDAWPSLESDASEALPILALRPAHG